MQAHGYNFLFLKNFILINTKLWISAIGPNFWFGWLWIPLQNTHFPLWFIENEVLEQEAEWREHPGRSNWEIQLQKTLTSPTIPLNFFVYLKHYTTQSTNNFWFFHLFLIFILIVFLFYRYYNNLGNKTINRRLLNNFKKSCCLQKKFI